jgi:hypothetical protein
VGARPRLARRRAHHHRRLRHTGSATMTDQMHAAADSLYEQITSPA